MDRPFTVCEYIWLDHNNDFRSKTRVIHTPTKELTGLPIWNYDGSSTKQADGNSSEVFIKPVKVCPNPFRKVVGGLLVLCDTWVADKKESKEKEQLVYKPHPDNTRHKAVDIFSDPTVFDQDCWYGMEQEFFFTNKARAGKDDKLGHPRFFEAPLGMTSADGKEWVSLSGKEQGDFYCGSGSNNVFGRQLAEKLLENCLYAELTTTGFNFEVAPGQCEFQIFGKGIDAADQLLLFRYIAKLTAEQDNININFHPKPMDGDWNGSGCHTNFSTKNMRNRENPEDSYASILQAITILKDSHDKHIAYYGTDNKLRLTGKHETADWKTFTHGVADRSASVRVPSQTYFDKHGYIEDRRPSSNCDPYIVTSLLAQTVVLMGADPEKPLPSVDHENVEVVEE